MNRLSLSTIFTALAAGLILSSCGPTKDNYGTLNPKAVPATTSSSPGRSGGLEVPPDLVDTTSDQILDARASTEQEARSRQVLPELENLRVERRNNEEGWIEVSADADQVWSKLINHWASLEINLVEANPTTGFMETDWVNPTDSGDDENRGTFGTLLRTVTSKFFDLATSLDKYMIQLERVGESSTRINVTHKGLKKIQTQESTKQYNEEFEWVETEEQPDKVRQALTSIAYGLNSDYSDSS